MVLLFIFHHRVATDKLFVCGFLSLICSAYLSSFVVLFMCVVLIMPPLYYSWRRTWRTQLFLHACIHPWATSRKVLDLFSPNLALVHFRTWKKRIKFWGQTHKVKSHLLENQIKSFTIRPRRSVDKKRLPTTCYYS